MGTKSLRDNVLPACAAILSFSFFVFAYAWTPGNGLEDRQRETPTEAADGDNPGPISGPLAIPTDMKRDRIVLPEFRGRDRAEIEAPTETPKLAPREDAALQLGALRVASVAFAEPTELAVSVSVPKAPGLLQPYRISSASASSGGWLGNGRTTRVGGWAGGTSLGPITGSGRGIGGGGIGGGGGGAGCAAPPGGR